MPILLDTNLYLFAMRSDDGAAFFERRFLPLVFQTHLSSIVVEKLYPPSQKTMGVSPWMNATVGPSEARRAKEGASADSAEERKDTTGVNPWRLHAGALDAHADRGG